MTIKLNHNGPAVDTEYFWKEMSSCTPGHKVQLLGPGGVAVYGTWNGRDAWWLGWAPLPKIRRDEK